MCVLHIRTDRDNLDLILNTNLPIYQVHKKGKKHKFRKKEIGPNLISCSVSEKEWSDFTGQTEDMISFIDKYQKELQLIKEKFSSIDWEFDLPYENRMNDTLFCQSDFLPSELLLKSGKLGIGITLSLYNTETE